MKIRAIILAIAFLVPISAGAQTDVDCVALVDSDGNRVARLLGNQHVTPVFYIEDNGFAVPLLVGGQAIFGTRNQLRFTDTTCSSAPYVNSQVTPVSPISVVIGQDVYY
jgi:hypothetical protein